jgi:hypothetical protein
VEELKIMGIPVKEDAELKRLKQAISDHDQANRYNGRLVAELLMHMGLIHKTPESMQRWGR